MLSKNLKKEKPVLLMSKQLQSSQLVLSSQREAFFLQQSLFPQQKKRLQKIRLNNTAVHSRSTSLTAEDFQRQSRGFLPYGKNQFSIRYRKTGTDHTLTVNQAMIRGEPILSISALKVPLCRQRFMRICPLFLSHTEQT